jgi:hypothetical protein
VISGGTASGDDAQKEQRNYVKFIIYCTILEADKKILCSDKTIIFSKKDGTEIAQPHDDALVLNLKIVHIEFAEFS